MSNNITRLRSRSRHNEGINDEYDTVELYGISFSTPNDEETGKNQAISPFDEAQNPQTQSDPQSPPNPPTPQNQDKTTKNLPFIFKHTSVVLENTGSVARDHMANERTFLAWARTSSIFITLAITFTQFLHITRSVSSVTIGHETFDLSQFSASHNWPLIHYGKAVEIMGFCLGIIALLFGAIRFFHIQNLLTRDLFPVTRVPVFVLLSVNITMLAMLLVLDIEISE